MEPESERTVHEGRLIRLALETWPQGDREVVHHPGAAGILATTASGAVVLVAQLREAVRDHVLEIPAGILDVPGEDPAAAAARELLEETGYRATAVEPLGELLSSPGFTDERIALFLCRVGDAPSGPAEDGVEVRVVPLPEALADVRGGRIRDAKTVAALLLAGDRLGAPGPDG